MREIVLATGNRGKVAEFAAILAAAGVQVRAQSDFDVPVAAETGLSFVENAIIKARNAAEFTKFPAIADDSGLAVDALYGAPGIRSARYAGAAASEAENLTKLLADTAHLHNGERACRFICVIAYLRHADDPFPIICDGVWEGSLLREPRGAQGFGYDPIFRVASGAGSAAELLPAHKNRISHRGQALAKFVDALRSEIHVPAIPRS